MIRIPRKQLDAAVDRLRDCAHAATDVRGRRIEFPLDREEAERAILGALSMFVSIGPATASDVYFFSDIKEPEWPPKVAVK